MLMVLEVYIIKTILNFVHLDRDENLVWKKKVFVNNIKIILFYKVTQVRWLNIYYIIKSKYV